MIALYMRQSVDKKDSISIETQSDMCLREVENPSDTKSYIDKGFSGKNTNRPAFTQMLNDIENGLIEKVIVYRLDRFSRSITDFANLMTILDKHNVAFASCTEKFDTSSPAGKAMLYIVMVFAQLERETIATRIKDNYYARGKLGVWLGGPAPLGFDIAKIDRASTLIPNKDIALVQEIFELYDTSTITLGGLAKIMRAKTGFLFNSCKLSRILHNPTYVKADADIYRYYKTKNIIILNEPADYNGTNGLCLYGKRDRGANKYTSEELHCLSVARHAGVIPADVFLRCQLKLSQNKQIKNTGKGKHSWLTGLVKCGYCGYNYKVVNKKYLVCTGAHQGQCTIDRGTHYLDVIEDYVRNDLKNYLESNDFQHAQEDDLSGQNELKLELIEIENKIAALISNLESANSTLIEYINKKIVELDTKKNELETKLLTKAVKPRRPAIEINLDGWEDMEMSQRAAIARAFIDKIIITNGQLKTIWKI